MEDATLAKLSKIPNGYLLTALEAKNRVMVNSQSQNRMFLNHSDRVQMGRIDCWRRWFTTLFNISRAQ